VLYNIVRTLWNLFLLFFFNACGGTLGTVATTGLLYQPRMISEGDCGEIGGMKIGRGNRSTQEKMCRSATLSATNPTWLDLGSNLGHHGGKPATNRLSCGVAFICLYCNWCAGNSQGREKYLDYCWMCLMKVHLIRFYAWIIIDCLGFILKT
jgi:hypothetical protein